MNVLKPHQKGAVVTLLENELSQHEISRKTGIDRKTVRKLRKYVRKELQAQLPAREWRSALVIGSGGTFTNLAGMALHRQGITGFPTVHGTTVSRVELEHILDALQGMSLDERLTVPGLNQGRADIIVGGLAVIAEVMARLDTPRLVVSGYGIREGILLENARILPSVAGPGDARERSVRRLAEACHFEERHSTQVQRLALQLFDALGPRLGCAPQERRRRERIALLRRSSTTSATTSATTGTTGTRTISSRTPSSSGCRRRSSSWWRTSRAITAAPSPIAATPSSRRSTG